jgi:outer membrane protein assembly factor BamD (BamD/ComL family)
MKVVKEYGYEHRYRWIPGAFVLVLLLLTTFSCAGKMPVLYQEDGTALRITDYEKIAQKEFDERRYDNAIIAYTAIISNYPENTTASAWSHYEIGYCYYLKKDLDQAEFYFRKVSNDYQDPAAIFLADMMIGKIIEERELKQQRKQKWKKKTPQEE